MFPMRKRKDSIKYKGLGEFLVAKPAKEVSTYTYTYIYYGKLELFRLWGYSDHEYISIQNLELSKIDHAHLLILIQVDIFLYLLVQELISKSV